MVDSWVEACGSGLVPDICQHCGNDFPGIVYTVFKKERTKTKPVASLELWLCPRCALDIASGMLRDVRELRVIR